MHSPVERAPQTGWPTKTDHYRPDIDGLRAWAVLSVVIFHAFPRAMQGGFVGVDVFFVISGFLITSIIIDGLDRGTFSFREFYVRRIKRIFPALILVLSASLILGWFVLLPDEYRQLGKHVTAGAGFISNLIFWREAGYFDVAADTKILLHLWSLGIEEQYYLIWPALVWAAWQKRLNLLTLFVAIWLISFYSNVHEVRLNATAAFYSPLSRFWELMAGSLLAYLVRVRSEILAQQEARISSWIQQIVFRPGYGNPETGLREASALTGAALLTFSMFAISQQKLFPGWWALLPTTGAYLIIFAGPKAWFNRAILSNRILVWFGLISYPLYLWHWPLFAFARNTVGDTPSPPIRIAFVAVSIGLAWLTYRLVEIPIRFRSRKPVTIFVLGSLMIGIAGFGYYDFANNGLGFRLKDRDEYAAYFEGYLYDASKHVVERKQIAQNQCNFYRWDNSPGPPNGPRDSIDPSCYTKHSQKSVLILGDSNAADLYYGLKEVLPKDISTLLIFSSGCTVRPIVEADLQADHCNMTNYFALNQIKKDPPDIVLMSSNSSFNIDYIRQVAPLMKGYGVKHVFVLGQRPHWKPYLYKLIIKNYWYFTPRYIPGHQDTELLALGDEFKSKMTPAETFEYIDQHDVFCNSDGCLTYLGDDRRDGLITFDDAHLRPFASVYLAKLQLAPLIIKRLQQDSATVAPK